MLIMATMEMGSVVLKAKSISGISAAFAASTTSPEVGESINRRRRSADSGGSAAVDANVDHHREQRRHQQYSQTGCRGDGQRHQAGNEISGDHQ